VTLNFNLAIDMSVPVREAGSRFDVQFQ